jgi:hypothetical protein
MAGKPKIVSFGFKVSNWSNNIYIDPPDDDLHTAFTEFARENSGAGLEWQDQVARLKQDFGLDIGQV